MFNNDVFVQIKSLSCEEQAVATGSLRTTTGDAEAAVVVTQTNPGRLNLRGGSSSGSVTVAGGGSDPDTRTKSDNLTIAVKLTADGTNYSRWAANMVPLLGYHKLLERTDANSPWKIKANLDDDLQFKVLLILNKNIQPSIQDELATYKIVDAKLAWEHLESRFGGSSGSDQVQAMQTMVSKTTFDLETIIADALSVVDAGNVMKEALKSDTLMVDHLVALVLISALPHNFDYLRSKLSLDITNTQLKTPTELVKTLTAELKGLKNRASPSTTLQAFVATPDQPESRCPKHPHLLAHRCFHCIKSLDFRNMKCSSCGTMGHKSETFHKCTNFNPANARKRRRETENTAHVAAKSLTDRLGDRPSSSDIHMAFACAQAPDFDDTLIEFTDDETVAYSLTVESYNPLKSNYIIVDSGASPSHVFNKQLLTNFTKLSSVVKTASKGQDMISEGHGTLTIGGISLPNTSYCPDMQVNLLSTSAMCDIGLTAEFTANNCFIRRGSDIVVTAYRNQGLYGIVIKEPTNAAYSAITTNNNIDLWHRRLGHLNHRSMISLSGMADGLHIHRLPPADSKCLDCLKAKATRRTHRPSDTRASRKGDLVHTDIVAISTMSICGGHKYFITFLDDYSRYLVIVLLQKKSQALDAFTAYDARCANIFGRHIGTLRSDGRSNDKGTEYWSHAFTAYCSEHGIFRQSSAAHSPDENGRSERINRTLVEGANAMLTSARLPASFWAYAVMTKAHLLNRSPHSRIPNMTPYQLWTDLRPDLSGLKVFGTAAVVHIPKANRTSKFGNEALHGAECVCIGYSTIIKGWLFWDYNKSKPIAASSAKFGNEIFNINERQQLATKSNLLVPASIQCSLWDNRQRFHRTLEVEQQVRSEITTPKSNTDPPHTENVHPPPSHRNPDTRHESYCDETTLSDANTDTEAYTNNAQLKRYRKNSSEDDDKDVQGVITYTERLPHSPTHEEYPANVPLPKKSGRKHGFDYQAIDYTPMPIEATKITSAPKHSTRRPNQIRTYANLVSHNLPQWINHIPTTVDQYANHATADSNDWFNMALLTVDAGTTDMNPTFEQAMKTKHKYQFLKAIKKEYDSLDQNRVFAEVPSIPNGLTALGTKMVLKIKETQDKDMEQVFKARLCGKGFKQVYGIDYYAPVAAFDALRGLLAILCMLDYEIDTTDVVTAFLLPILKEEVYIKIPDGYIVKDQLTKFLRLRKTLYGLKQSPYMWNKEISDYLISIGFTQFITDRCIFVGTVQGSKIYILLYVDDAIIGAPNRTIMQHVKALIHAKFPITDRGPLQFYLNCHFIRNRTNRTIEIHQWAKIDALIKEFHTEAWNHTTLPGDPTLTLTADQCPTDPTLVEQMTQYPYRRLVGIILYVAITARPDIATAISTAGRFSHNPALIHWTELLRILGYLKTTSRHTLTLGGHSQDHQCNIHAYTDSNWAGGEDRRKSRTGMAIYINNSLIIYQSKLQSGYALSSMEAETNAGCVGARNVTWLRNFLNEMGYTQTTPTVMYQDNKACKLTNESYKAHPGTRYYELKQYYLRHKNVELKEIEMFRIPTGDMTADIFTKQLPNILFRKHQHSLGVGPRAFPSPGGVGNTPQDNINKQPHTIGVTHPTRNRVRFTIPPNRESAMSDEEI
jgi:transposase InsO family protein